MPGQGDAQNVMLVMVEILSGRTKGRLLCGRLDGYRH
jgi:ribosomal protein S28E/S33